MTDLPLGRLTRVELQDVWQSEASHFTPWLARGENLAVLAETLGLELELEAQEKSVGPFRADLLCKDIGTGAWVLIENQLQRTDHTHLGQLLTYASGLGAATIIWIAARFTDEHRSTLDWLNTITNENFRFFGLEVELWRIAESPAAPKFNIVAQPNDWSRRVAQAARAIDSAELSETRAMQMAYWSGFNAALVKAGGPIPGHRKAQPQSWMAYSVGRSNFNLAGVMIRPKRQIRAELYIGGADAKGFFWALERQKSAIEQELGYGLAWEDLPEGRDCRVSVYLQDVDPEDEADWARQHAWLAAKVNDLYRVFAGRLRMLAPVTRSAEAPDVGEGGDGPR